MCERHYIPYSSPDTMLNMTFSERLIELALSIPPGRVVTYGSLARAAGGTGQAARSVGAILGKYPNQKAIPWHRIVYAGGRVWLDPECEAKRREMFELEGMHINQKGFVENFEELLLDFSELT